MKKLIASFSALILIAFIFSSCSESLNTETPSSAPSAVPGGKGTFSPNLMCANNQFPLYSNGPAYTMGLNYCGDGDEPVSAQSAAEYWSQFVASPINEDLGFQACDPIDGVKGVSWVQNLQEGNYPKLKWEFVYTHFFLIQRKIGSGAWTTIKTFYNKCVGANSYPYSTSNLYPIYIDSSINLSTNGYYVYYRVISKIFETTSSASPQIVYVPANPAPLTAGISGTTSCCIPAKGEPSNSYTWTANVSGGTPGYTYSWTWQGGVVSTSSSYTRTISYYAATTSTKTLTLTVTDAAGNSVVSSKSVVVATAADCIY